MKKIVILVLALVIIAAAFFLSMTKKEGPVEKPAEPAEPAASPIDLRLYPGAEFIMRKIQSAGDVSYYATNDSQAQVLEFYKAMFPDFEFEEDPASGYNLYNDKMVKLAEELQHRSKFMDWKEANKGLVLIVGVSAYDPTNEYYSEIENYREKLKDKTIIIIAHL